MTVSEVVEAKRQERGISVAELSRRTNIAYDTLTRVLKGMTRVKGDELVSLCKELDITIDAFF